jgi:hypothetical protein
MHIREIEWRYKLHSSGSGLRPALGSFEHGNVTSGSIKCWEILE